MPENDKFDNKGNVVFNKMAFLPINEAVASRGIFVILGSVGRTVGLKRFCSQLNNAKR